VTLCDSVFGNGVAHIAAEIAEPFPIDDIDTRAARLDDLLRI
jgi:hypothetical protein